MNKIVLISFPRSGGNFLIQKMFYDTGLRIEYRHNIKGISEDIILNIVRNPIDSIASMISMDNELNISKQTMSDINFAKYKIIPYYLAIYDCLLNSKKQVIFINYEDLNKDKTFTKLYKLLNISLKNNNNENFNFIKDIENYQITSKNNDNYNTIKQEISNIDFTKCFNIYNKALENCITV